MRNVGEIYRLETENKTLQFENFGIYEFIEFKEIQIRLFCQCVIKAIDKLHYLHLFVVTKRMEVI